MNQQDDFLDSAGSVRKELMEKMGLDVTEQDIKRAMRQELSMKFKKVVPISIHGNSAKNLVLRQQYARNLIRLK